MKLQPHFERLPVIFLGLFLCCQWETGFVSAQQDPEKSTYDAPNEVKITVTNTTAGAVDVFWVNYEGQNQGFGNIPAGQQMELMTFPGNLWKFAQGGNLVGRFRANSQGVQNWQIKAGGQPAQNPSNNTTPPPPTPTQQPPGGVTPPGTQPGGGVAPPGNNTGGTGSTFSAQEANAFVAYHNQKRAEVNVRPLQWSQALAREAQQWAEQIAATGKFEHRPKQGQWATKHGENLAAGSGGGYNVIQAAEGWYSEKPKYNPGTPFNWTQMQSAAHYTQMVWQKTTEIGAGKAVIKTGEYAGWTVVVANYNPAGNFEGQLPYPVR